jgi:hypothetical protein
MALLIFCLQLAGYQTRMEGAGGNAECMAPPGFELKDGAEWISECEIGFYKEGWNKNPCIPVSGSPGWHLVVEPNTGSPTHAASVYVRYIKLLFNQIILAVLFALRLSPLLLCCSVAVGSPPLCNHAIQTTQER